MAEQTRRTVKDGQDEDARGPIDTRDRRPQPNAPETVRVASDAGGTSSASASLTEDGKENPLASQDGGPETGDKLSHADRSVATSGLAAKPLDELSADEQKEFHRFVDEVSRAGAVAPEWTASQHALLNDPDRANQSVYVNVRGESIE